MKGKYNMTYPLVFQKGCNDCGPACIFSLCIYYNITYDKKEILKLAEITSIGTSIWHMQVVLESLGFSCEAVYINDFLYYDYRMPIIAMIKANRIHFHYVIIYEKKQKSLIIGDPAIGIQEIQIEKFLTKFTNMVIIPQFLS